MVRERFSLSDLMKRAGGMDEASFFAMLRQVDVRTMETLLNDDATVQKLASYLHNIARDSDSAIKDKILHEEKIYRHLTTYQKFLFAKLSAEDCVTVLSNPALSQDLDGQQLFELATKFSACASILKIITGNPNLQKKYQAYFNLFNYSLPQSGSAMVAERQKVLAWIKDAQIDTKDVTGEKFKNAAVKHVLASDRHQLHILDINALNDLAEADEKIALEIISTPALLNKFANRHLGALYLFRLSRKYLNVCLAVLKNSAAVQWLDGCYLFDLCQHHAAQAQIVQEAIASNPSAKKRYDAYYQLLHYSFSQTISDAKAEEQILALYRQANLDETQTEGLLKNAVLALVLLKYNLVGYKFQVIDKHPRLASYLIERHRFFPKAFECEIFFEHLLDISKAICLQVLSTTALFDRLTGERLVRFCKKYGDEVLNKVLDNPILMDKYRAYLSLSQLTHQAGVHVERDQKQFSSPALMDAKSNQDYERGVFLQEQGKFELALDYFHKALQAEYQPAGSAIKSLILKLLSVTSSLSIEMVRKCMQIAKAFADPRNSYYDESIPTLIYLAVLMKENLPDEVISEGAYIVGRRFALGLGESAPKQEQSNGLFRAFGNRQLLLTCCEADVRERRKIKTEMQHEVACMASAEVDDLVHEPAVLFLQNEKVMQKINY